jgi:hypothetical protein
MNMNTDNDENSNKDGDLLLKLNFDTNYSSQLCIKDLMKLFYHQKPQSCLRILILSDSRNIMDHSTLGEHYFNLLQDLKPFSIISTDFDSSKELSGSTPMEMKGFMNLNNLKTPFPFENDSFDLILMRGGICICDDQLNVPCAIPGNSDAALNFLIEINRILRRGFAFLHGNGTGCTKKCEKFWKDVANKRKENLNIKMVYVDNKFRGIRIDKS